jgi:hypothetical protein
MSAEHILLNKSIQLTAVMENTIGIVSVSLEGRNWSRVYIGLGVLSWVI